MRTAKRMGLLGWCCLVFSAAAACAPRASPQTPDFLFGSWQWVESTGGIAGTTITPRQAGIAVRYRFERDGSLEVFHNPGDVTYTRFTVAEQPGLGGAPPRPVLRYKDPVNVLPPPVSEQFFRLTAPDTLVLTDSCADCYQHTLARVL